MLSELEGTPQQRGDAQSIFLSANKNSYQLLPLGKQTGVTVP
jgi:hypothetical protein